MDIKSNVLFSESLYQVELNLDNNALVQFTHDVRADHPTDLPGPEGGTGYQHSFGYGWHDECNTLLNKVREVTNQIVRTAYGIEFDSFNKRIHGWFNVGNNRSYNMPHYHPGTYWSAVYYAQVPEDNHILFHRPEYGLHAEWLCRLTDGESYTKTFLAPEAVEVQTVRPTAGTLIVFPSKLMHCAGEQKEGSVERIAFGCNIGEY